MSSTTSSQKRIEKVSSDNLVISFDLLSNLTYMATLSLGGPPRDILLQRAGALRLKTSVFFEQVHLLAQKLGVEYTRALQVVAGRARASAIKGLFLRFASTIGSGESEQIFLRQEAKLENQRYVNEYQRSVETLKKWTDAYAAMLVSVTLIVIVALVSTLMGAVSQTFVLIIGGAMFLITSGGVYVIMRTAPYEDYTYDGVTKGTPERRKARFYLRLLGGVGLILSLIVGVTAGFGPALLVMGVFLYPAGYYAAKDDKKVRAIDREISTFVRGLGNIAAAKGATLSRALRDLDLKSMGSLEPYVLRLRTRLNNQMPPHLCWEQFRSELGNELVVRSSEMLVDGVELGGSPEEVGQLAASYASTVAELREMRKLTAASFSFLVYPMHVAMVGLLLFILEVVANFNTRLGNIASEVTEQALAGSAAQTTGLSMFQVQDLGLITAMIMLVVLVLTVANALAPKFASGGHTLKIVSGLSLMCILSGLLMIAVPRVAGVLIAG